MSVSVVLFYSFILSILQSELEEFVSKSGQKKIVHQIKRKKVLEQKKVAPESEQRKVIPLPSKQRNVIPPLSEWKETYSLPIGMYSNLAAYNMIVFFYYLEVVCFHYETLVCCNSKLKLSLHVRKNLKYKKPFCLQYTI